MATLATHFKTALSNIEPSGDAKNAQSAHAEVTAALEADDLLVKLGVDPLLIGSYGRHASIRRVKDVDVFARLSKSTLATMIATLRTPTSGTIRYNGHPTDDWDTDALRARIGVVTQERPFTAATNIAVGDITTTPEQDRIEAAATRAVAHDMITELPHGYETLLDRTFAGGQDLSGGQWQRITAARGFLRDADLLIMDEPSSALDPRAEDALFQAIRDRQRRGTTILITHRLANVRHADRIYVLHHGRLVESGTHDQLMNADGRYAELFTLQAAGFTTPATPAPLPRQPASA